MALDAYIPSKMPLYRPEQLEEGLQVADIRHVYLFSSGEPNCFVDVSRTLQAKVEAVLRHKSQFEEPERVREWLTNRAREAGERQSAAPGLTARTGCHGKHGVEYAEEFRHMRVW